MVRVFALSCVLAIGFASTSSAQSFIGFGLGSGIGPGSFGYGGFGPSFGYGGFGPSLGYGGFGPRYGSGISVGIGGGGYRGYNNYGYAPRVYSSGYRAAPVYRSAPVYYRPTVRYQNSSCNCRRCY